MDTSRRKFQGVLNILSFNRHFYFGGLSVLFILVAVAVLYSWPVYILWLIVGSFLYGLLVPLFISAYVYDFSGYYNFAWLNELQGDGAENIVNINAGFDETSFILQSRFPDAVIRVFDFYDAKRHTEPAIKRARKVSLVFPDTRQISSDVIPMDDDTVDLVFLLSAAHEIRSQEEKICFLRECRRICKPSGKVIMVEHLRDFPNFLAFTIGFSHFFSAKIWRKAYAKAGFTNIREKKFTPFMSVFYCTTNSV